MESSKLLFRQILPSDLESMKALHDEFFPVKYSEQFYRDTCDGIGINGGKLFSCLATAESGEIVGFILAQMFDYPAQCEDKDMFANDRIIGKVCYVITLGVVEQQRQTGLGSTLLNYCIQYAQSIPECGAVYLHVLHSNNSALRFYRKNNFLELRYLSNFYYFNGAHHSAYLYIFYVNRGTMPTFQTTWLSASYWLEASFTFLSNLLYYFPRADQLFSSLPHPTGIAGLGAVLDVTPGTMEIIASKSLTPHVDQAFGSSAGVEDEKSFRIACDFAAADQC